MNHQHVAKEHVPSYYAMNQDRIYLQHSPGWSMLPHKSVTAVAGPSPMHDKDTLRQNDPNYTPLYEENSAGSVTNHHAQLLAAQETPFKTGENSPLLAQPPQTSQHLETTHVLHLPHEGFSSTPYQGPFSNHHFPLTHTVHDSFIPVVASNAHGVNARYLVRKLIHKTNLGHVLQGLRCVAPDSVSVSVYDQATLLPLPSHHIVHLPFTSDAFLGVNADEFDLSKLESQHNQNPTNNNTNTAENVEKPHHYEGYTICPHKSPGLYIAPHPDVHNQSHSYTIHLLCKLNPRDSAGVTSIILSAQEKYRTSLSQLKIEYGNDGINWSFACSVRVPVDDMPVTIKFPDPYDKMVDRAIDAQFFRLTLNCCNQLALGCLTFNTDVAIKKSDRRVMFEQNHGDNPLKEALVMKLTTSPFTPRIIDVHDDVRFDKQYHYIITKFYKSGDMYHLLNSNRTPTKLKLLSPHTVGIYFAQLCLALYYLHHVLHIAHLDIKPANILLDGNNCYLADLGVAKRLIPRNLPYNNFTNGDLFDEEYFLRTQPPRLPFHPMNLLIGRGVGILESGAGSAVKMHNVFGLLGTKDYMDICVVNRHNQITKQHQKLAAEAKANPTNPIPTCCTFSQYPDSPDTHCAREIHDLQLCRFHYSLEYGYDARLADVYSLGVVLFTLLFKIPPYCSFPGQDNKHYQLFVARGAKHLAVTYSAQFSNLKDNYDDRAFELIDKMTHPDPNKRFFIEDVINHPYTKHYLAELSSMTAGRRVIIPSTQVPQQLPPLFKTSENGDILMGGYILHGNVVKEHFQSEPVALGPHKHHHASVENINVSQQKQDEHIKSYDNLMFALKEYLLNCNHTQTPHAPPLNYADHSKLQQFLASKRPNLGLYNYNHSFINTITIVYGVPMYHSLKNIVLFDKRRNNSVEDMLKVFNNNTIGQITRKIFGNTDLTEQNYLAQQKKASLMQKYHKFQSNDYSSTISPLEYNSHTSKPVINTAVNSLYYSNPKKGNASPSSSSQFASIHPQLLVYPSPQLQCLSSMSSTSIISQDSIILPFGMSAPHASPFNNRTGGSAMKFLSPHPRAHIPDSFYAYTRPHAYIRPSPAKYRHHVEAFYRYINYFDLRSILTIPATWPQLPLHMQRLIAGLETNGHDTPFATAEERQAVINGFSVFQRVHRWISMFVLSRCGSKWNHEALPAVLADLVNVYCQSTFLLTSTVVETYDSNVNTITHTPLVMLRGQLEVATYESALINRDKEHFASPSNFAMNALPCNTNLQSGCKSCFNVFKGDYYYQNALYHLDYQHTLLKHRTAKQHAITLFSPSSSNTTTPWSSILQDYAHDYSETTPLSDIFSRNKGYLNLNHSLTMSNILTAQPFLPSLRRSQDYAKFDTLYERYTNFIANIKNTGNFPAFSAFLEDYYQQQHQSSVFDFTSLFPQITEMKIQNTSGGVTNSMLVSVRPSVIQQTYDFYQFSQYAYNHTAPEYPLDAFHPTKAVSLPYQSVLAFFPHDYNYYCTHGDKRAQDIETNTPLYPELIYQAPNRNISRMQHTFNRDFEAALQHRKYLLVQSSQNTGGFNNISTNNLDNVNCIAKNPPYVQCGGGQYNISHNNLYSTTQQQKDLQPLDLFHAEALLNPLHLPFSPMSDISQFTRAHSNVMLDVLPVNTTFTPHLHDIATLYNIFDVQLPPSLRRFLRVSQPHLANINDDNNSSLHSQDGLEQQQCYSLDHYLPNNTITDITISSSDQVSHQGIQMIYPSVEYDDRVAARYTSPPFFKEREIVYDEIHPDSPHSHTLQLRNGHNSGNSCKKTVFSGIPSTPLCDALDNVNTASPVDQQPLPKQQKYSQSRLLASSANTPSPQRPLLSPFFVSPQLPSCAQLLQNSHGNNNISAIGTNSSQLPHKQDRNDASTNNNLSVVCYPESSLSVSQDNHDINNSSTTPQQHQQQFQPTPLFGRAAAYTIPIEIILPQNYPNSPPIIALLPIMGFAINKHCELFDPQYTHHYNIDKDNNETNPSHKYDERNTGYGVQWCGIITAEHCQRHNFIPSLANWSLNHQTNCKTNNTSNSQGAQQKQQCESTLLSAVLYDLKAYFTTHLPPYIADSITPTYLSRTTTVNLARSLNEQVMSFNQQIIHALSDQKHPFDRFLYPSSSQLWQTITNFLAKLMIQQSPYHFSAFSRDFGEYHTCYLAPRAIPTYNSMVTPLLTVYDFKYSTLEKASQQFDELVSGWDYYLSRCYGNTTTMTTTSPKDTTENIFH